MQLSSETPPSEPRRIVVFIGTRPEAIKLAPVVSALQAAADFDCRVVSTGQHREMLQQVIDVFELSVDRELSVMEPGQRLPALTARLITASEAALAEEQPALVLVQGDTTSVFAAALASFYRGIPVGHVEAGLRTGDLKAPFPEEANRVLTSHLSALHFAPTDRARQNLLREGVDEGRILVTGNTVIDALHMEVARQQRPAVRAQIEGELAELLRPDWRERNLVLITGHRRENFGSGFERICASLAQLARRFPQHDFVYPVHLNPNVQAPVYRILAGIDNVRLIPPQPYSRFVSLLVACRLVLTDSGGVQEEAPGLGKPVLVMRDKTERPEGVDAGTVRLVGTDRDAIVEQVSILLSSPERYAEMASAKNPYGDGHAAHRIVARIRTFLEASSQPCA